MPDALKVVEENTDHRKLSYMIALRSYEHIEDHLKDAMKVPDDKFSKFLDEYDPDGLSSMRQAIQLFTGEDITKELYSEFTKQRLQAARTQLDANTRRVAHALNALKKKDRYATDMESLLRLTKKISQESDFKPDRDCHMAVLLGVASTGIVTDLPVPDTAYYGAIEATVWMCNRSLFCDGESLYAMTIKNHYDIFCYNLAISSMLMAIHANYMETYQWLPQNRDTADDLVRLSHQVSDQQEQIHTLEEQLESEKLNHEKEIDGLKQDQVRTAQILQELQDTKKQLDWATELSDSQEGLLREKDRSIDALTKENESLKQLLLEKDVTQPSKFDTMCDMPPERTAEPWPLPESGIAFVGGHTNMINKLRSLHPGWDFYDEDLRTASSMKRCDYLFFYTNHMSHPLYYRARALMPESTKVLYVSGTNLDLLESEMRQALHVCKTVSES